MRGIKFKDSCVQTLHIELQPSPGLALKWLAKAHVLKNRASCLPIALMTSLTSRRRWSVQSLNLSTAFSDPKTWCFSSSCGGHLTLRPTLRENDRRHVHIRASGKKPWSVCVVCYVFCMYICMCAYICVEYVCACVYVYECMCVRVVCICVSGMCICVCLCMCVCMCVREWCAHVCVCDVCICVHVQECMQACSQKAPLRRWSCLSWFFVPDSCTWGASELETSC